MAKTPDDTPVRKPRVSVLERRLQNPFGEPSAPVHLKDDSLMCRWFNSTIRPDQFWRAKELGWEGVTPDMIVDLAQIGFHTKSAEGYVARGERAQEVLMYMPKDDYRKIQAAKTARNLREMKDMTKQQQDALSAYAAQGGNADAITELKGFNTVKTMKERVQQVTEE